MKTQWIRTLGILTVALLLMPLLACNGSSNSPTASNTSGSLRINLKDAPTDQLSAVTVYISGLKVKASGMPVQTLAADIGPVNLLDLQTDPIQLVAAAVDPGDYQYIQVELDPSQSSVTETDTQAVLPLQIPSSKIKILGGFTVDANNETTVTLDFNADKSLIQRGNGSWLMKPVIVIDSVN